MGCFSWMYSDIDEQVINGKKRDSYLLVPEKYQEKYGKAICEKCYDGYGHFSKYDIYNLIIEWNKEIIPDIIERIKNNNWHCIVKENDIINLENYYANKPISCDLRWLGIIIACYDEDNFALKYPIKITSKEMDYNKARPSKSDEQQGWE